MSRLQLDPRQRAMLQEMGVRLWWPAPAPPQGAAGKADAPDTGPHRPPSSDATAPATSARPMPMAAAPPAPHPITPAPAHPAAVPLLLPPRALFPDADPQQTPAALGASWLIVAEGMADAEPFAGDAGRLLANMLRALRLHLHPRAYLCTLATPGGMAAGEPPASVLASALADLRPAVLLLMGRPAARAVLGRTEPLGRLRSELHQVHGVPAIVTYDAPYLLRAPDAKSAAWADLCRARALAGAGSGASPAG